MISDKNGLNFPPEIWIYGLISCALYALGFYTMYVAIGCGSFAVTRLVSSFSIMFPLLFGLLFLNEPSSPLMFTGVALIIISMVLVNYKSSVADAVKPSAKWAICLILTTVANGFISIVSRLQQIRFNNACSNEFLIISLGGSFLFLMVAGILKDKGRLGYILKHGCLFGLFTGMCNGIKNYLTLSVYLLLPLSVASPLQTGMGLIITFLISLFLYKEKFSGRQIAGAILGMVALVLLNL